MNTINRNAIDYIFILTQVKHVTNKRLQDDRATHTKQINKGHRDPLKPGGFISLAMEKQKM